MCCKNTRTTALKFCRGTKVQTRKKLCLDVDLDFSDFHVWIRVWVFDFSDPDKPEKTKTQTQIHNRKIRNPISHPKPDFFRVRTSFEESVFFSKKF